MGGFWLYHKGKDDGKKLMALQGDLNRLFEHLHSPSLGLGYTGHFPPPMTCIWGATP